jgi:hypothetical protein
MAGKAGPFVVAGGGADYGQLQICLSLMQPVGGTIHLPIVVTAQAATSNQQPAANHR